jgi:hypothetical protein
MVDASVIICSHNPRPHYLRRVLSALKDQTLAKDRWELLLIDNASDKPLAPDYDLSWHRAAAHVREPELGLAFARRCGIQKAKGDIFVFADDDNLLDGGYLEQALGIGVSNPNLGTWGAGTIRGEFERELARHLRPYSNYLALRDNKQTYFSNILTCGAAIPLGAGLCVRSTVANEYLRFCANPANIRITGRRGTSLVGHEDYEISFVGCQMGFGMGVFPELKMTHLIPEGRSTDDYFLRLLEGCRISGTVLDFKWPTTYAGAHLARSPRSIRGLLSLGKNALLKRGFDRSIFFANRRGTIKGREIIFQGPRDNSRGSATTPSLDGISETVPTG